MTVAWADGRRSLAAAFILGVLGVGAFAPLGWFPLIWVALGGLFFLFAEAATPRRALFVGWTFGFGCFLAGVSWIYVSLSVFGGMPFWLAGPATVLFCAVLAGYPAIVGWVFRRWLPDAAWRRVALFAALWALGEWLRGWLFTGFPWLAAGYSQAPPSPLAGFAPIVGVYGLSLLSAALGACLALAVVERPPLAMVPVVVVLALGGALAKVTWTRPSGAPISVALIQGNVPQEMKFLPEHFIRTLYLYRDLVAQHPAQLTILPETAVPAFLEDIPPAYLDDLGSLARRRDGDLVFGAVSGNRRHYWNSAISLGSAPMQVYSKRHLVPFGEFVPPGFVWFMGLVHIPLSDFERGGDEPTVLAVGGRKVAVNICYEDAFGEELIRDLPMAGMLVNMSNTAWFGHSLAQPQHLQISRMRALETGRPMLRATNTGMTAVVRPDGEVQAVLPPFATGVLTADVTAYEGMTPFSRWGNVAFLMLAAAALIAALLRRR